MKQLVKYPILPAHAVNRFWWGESLVKCEAHTSIYTLLKNHTKCSHHIPFSMSFLFLQLIMNLSNLFTSLPPNLLHSL